MKRILLLGGRSPAALELARAFAAARHEVFVAETTSCCVCAVSRAVTRFHRVPWPNGEGQGWVDAVLELIRRERIDLVVPTFEEVFHLSGVREGLPPHCELFADEHETLVELHSKWAFVRRLQALGLDAPRTFLVENRSDLQSVLARTRDVVLKPVWSRFSSRITFPPETDQMLERVSSEPGPWVAQELVRGREICTYSVARHGELVVHCAYPAELTAPGGLAVAFRHVDHDRIFDWVREFVRHEGFHGQIAFDFFETEDGRLVPIECNPRATSGVHLFEGRRALAAAFVDDTPELLVPRPSARAMLALPMLASLRVFWPDRLAQWSHAFSTSRDATWAPTDPLPLLMQFVGVGWMYWRSWRYRVPLRESATFDLEWNGATGGLRPKPSAKSGLKARARVPAPRTGATDESRPGPVTPG